MCLVVVYKVHFHMWAKHTTKERLEWYQYHKGLRKKTRKGGRIAIIMTGFQKRFKRKATQVRWKDFSMFQEKAEDRGVVDPTEQKKQWQAFLLTTKRPSF